MHGGHRLGLTLLMLLNAAAASAGTSNDPVFVLQPSSSFAPPERDLVQAPTSSALAVCPADAGAGWTCSWASDTFAAGQALGAGGSSVTLYARNAAGLRDLGSTGGTVKTLTVPVPTTVASGDVMIAAVAYHGSVGITAPAGWTLIQNTVLSFIEVSTYWRVAGAAEPASYAWDFGSNAAAGGVILAYVGVDASAPVAAVTQGSEVITTSHPFPAITTAADGVRLVAVQAVNSGATLSVPSGFTRQVSAGPSTLTLVVNDAVQWSAGPGGPWAATSSGTSDGVEQVIALAPSTTSPAACPLTATVLNGATVLGSVSVSATSGTPNPLVGNFSTPAVAFAAGDRLHLSVSAPVSAACSAQLLFGSATQPARLVVPLLGADAGADGGTDAGADAGADAGVDGGTDGGADAGADGGADAGFDGGTADGGPGDAGATDAGPDSGQADAGSCPPDCADGGGRGPENLTVGCGCGGGGTPVALVLALLAARALDRRRRRRR